MTTPGPWGIEQTATANWIGPLREDGSGKVKTIVVYTERAPLRPDVIEQVDADAKLISAAPELLDALEGLLHECEAYALNQTVPMQAAREALSKARGEKKP